MDWPWSGSTILRTLIYRKNRGTKKGTYLIFEKMGYVPFFVYDSDL